MKRLLITNDDGWDAPGIAVLADVASEFGEVIVIAPDRHLSGCSHQTTTGKPLELVQASKNVYHLTGTPADCVRVAVRALGETFDWVLSGVNNGGNLGVDVFMSGTAAAAREAAFIGIPAVSISQYRQSGRAVDWKKTTRWARAALSQALGNDCPLGDGSFWNINLPDPAADHHPEVKVCPLDPNPLDVAFELSPPAASPQQAPALGQKAAQRFQFSGKYQARGFVEGSDVAVCFGGDTAMTRVSLGDSFASR